MRAKVRKGLATLSFITELAVFAEAYKKGVAEYEARQNQSTTDDDKNTSTAQSGDK